jgi:3-oxoadipate enol-lactonase
MKKAYVNGINLCYAVHGQGEALVLIPGLGVDHTGWFCQVPALKRHFRVIIYDPRSLGKSERPRDSYDVRAMVDDVIGLMDWLDIKQAHIMGHSLGGIIAREIAINYPDRVAKLILASSAYGQGDVSEYNPVLMEVLGLTQGATEIDFARLNARRTLSTLIGLTFKNKALRLVTRWLAYLFIRPRMLMGLTDQLRAVAHYNSVEKLALIKAPTLIITGDEDRLVVPHCSELLADKIPSSKLVMMKGASHALNMETPNRFNHEVITFLKGHV